MSIAPPLRPLGERASQVVQVALELLETEGAGAVTMRRVAETLGIQAPSLYKHFPNKQAIEVAMIEVGLEAMGSHLHAALGGPGPRQEVVPRLLAAYREQSREHPNLYRLATSGPLARHLLTPGLEDWAGEPFFLATGDPFRAQALWSFAHGMVILEIDGRYPDNSDLDRTWAAGAAAFQRSE